MYHPFSTKQNTDRRIIIRLHHFRFEIVQIHIQLRSILMAELVYLQFHNNMTFQDAVIEYEVGKEIILINQDTFCRVSKQNPCPISSRKCCRLSRMDCSKSFSVTKACSFNPKNSKVTGVLITSLGCNKVACCWTKAERASLFWRVHYVHNIKMLFVVLTPYMTNSHEWFPFHKKLVLQGCQ